MADTPERGSPFAPHGADETAAMLEAVGVDTEDELFDIPDPVRFDDAFGIDPHGEREVRTRMAAMLSRNDDLVEFLGRGHYDHYVPSLVDHLADRSEFLTSYTQYQPEASQGFLQALFEYQSIVVELTGLPIANCSMYDHATALGEAALLADRVTGSDAARVLVSDLLPSERRSVLDNYTEGPGLTVETYPTDDGNVDLDGLAAALDDDVVMVHVENPNARGVIEESLADVAALAHDHDALCSMGSDPVALALLEEPAGAGVDVVIGDAATLGLPTAFGMGLGMFATREEYLRSVPGRLVGASTDDTDRRAFTLTLQTREQHIRRERATSNICTNQAWVALRAAMHAASLGPEGLLDLATEAVTRARELADEVDDLRGIRAPVHDRHHFREFVARTDQPAAAIASDLASEGYAVGVVGEHRIQICVTDTNADATDGLVAALEEVL